MILSRTGDYALRAATVLARHGTPMEVGALAHTLGLPRNYLSKTLNQLVHAGVLVSIRGKHGGFDLARPAADIRLLDVVSPFDRIPGPRQCILGQLVCHDRVPCPAHRQWLALVTRVERFFARTTLADAARGTIRWPNRPAPERSRTGRRGVP